jgi:hypothetical protein
VSEHAIIAALTAVRFHVASEAELQEAIARVLTEAKFTFEAEVRLTPKDRIDFMVGDVGLEVKLSGTTSEIAAQLQRYAASPLVRCLLLVTTRLRYGLFEGKTFLGKSVLVARVTGGFL